MAGSMFWSDEFVDISDEAAKFGARITVIGEWFIVTMQPAIHATPEL
jgi:hypothetical protein